MVIANVAVRVPTAFGTNRIVTLQLAPEASDPPTGQLVVCVKSPRFVPVIAIEIILRAAGPVFVSVTCCVALCVPTTWGANVKARVLTLTCVLLPLSATAGFGFTFAVVVMRTLD